MRYGRCRHLCFGCCLGQEPRICPFCGLATPFFCVDGQGNSAEHRLRIAVVPRVRGCAFVCCTVPVWLGPRWLARSVAWFRMACASHGKCGVCVCAAAFGSPCCRGNQDGKFTGYYYLARRRKRVFHCQTTHVLVRCVLCSDDTLALGQRRPFLFDFCTLWAVSRDVLRAGCTDLSLHVLSVTEDTFSSVKPTLPPRDSEFGIVVWPDVFKATRAVKPADALASLDGAAARRQRRKGVRGVRTVAPASVLLFAAAGAAMLPPAVVEKKTKRGTPQRTQTH